MNLPAPTRALRAALILGCALPLSAAPALRAADATPATTAAAPTAAVTGTIQGRVLSPATQEYMRNVEVTLPGTNLATFTGEDGFYTLTNVPAGARELTVAYTGYDSATARVIVSPGAIATRDFELLATGSRPASAPSSAAPGAPAGPVKLMEFVVSTEREGNAKAIMDQRRNMNITTSVASDIFGDVTDGNIGEFLKYLPGVDVDYVESETRGPRLGGMDAQYVGVSFDGMTLASADANRTGDLGRATSFEAFSISSIESIDASPEPHRMPSCTCTDRPAWVVSRYASAISLGTPIWRSVP